MSLQIDIIDFTKENAKNKFVKSLKNTGFAVLNNHQIDINLINTVYNEWANFFNSKDKYDYMFDLEKQDGYFPMKSENAKGYSVKDIKEFYHIYLPWGRIPEQLLKNTLLIRSKLKSIGIELLSWIDDLAPIDIKNNFSISSLVFISLTLNFLIFLMFF